MYIYVGFEALSFSSAIMCIALTIASMPVPILRQHRTIVKSTKI